MTGSVPAKLIRKRWIEWFSLNIECGELIDEMQGLKLQSQLKHTIKESGKRLSYELSKITQSEAIAAILSLIEKLTDAPLFVFVGDPIAPAVFSMDRTNELQRLLKKTAIEDQAVSLILRDRSGILTVDFPPEEMGDGELLLSGGGEFEQIVLDFESLFPGGIRFRGN